jgi:hypothetical protein
MASRSSVERDRGERERAVEVLLVGEDEERGAGKLLLDK